MLKNKRQQGEKDISASSDVQVWADSKDSSEMPMAALLFHLQAAAPQTQSTWGVPPQGGWCQLRAQCILQGYFAPPAMEPVCV